MKLTRVENYSYGKSQIKFGETEEKPVTKPAVEADDDEYEDESFWSRNKKTLTALGVIGAAGVAIVAVKHAKSKRVKINAGGGGPLRFLMLMRYGVNLRMN